MSDKTLSGSPSPLTSTKPSTVSSVFLGTPPEMETLARILVNLLPSEFLEASPEVPVVVLPLPFVILTIFETDATGLPPYPQLCEALSELVLPIPPNFSPLNPPKVLVYWIVPPAIISG